MRLKVIAFLAGLTLVAACDDENQPTIPFLEFEFAVTPMTITVDQDACASIDADLTTSGNEIDNADVDFASGDETIAVFDATDLDSDGVEDNTAGGICGVGGGATTFTVSTSSAQDTFEKIVQVTVIPDSVATVEIRPATGTLFLDAELELETHVVTQDGDTVVRNLTDSDALDSDIRRLAFTSSNTDVATVSSNGVITPVASGTVLIIASLEGVSDTTTLSVAPRPVETVEIEPNPAAVFVGDTVHLSVTLRAADQRELTGRDVAFSSSNALIATVDDAGIVTGKAPGGATITATSEGKSGQSTVSVTAQTP
ncbi:MAG: Ig-like domain-containing protein [Gemmatimonadaceae bacterium]